MGLLRYFSRGSHPARHHDSGLMGGKWGLWRSRSQPRYRSIVCVRSLFRLPNRSRATARLFVFDHCLACLVCCAVRFEFDAIHNPSASQEEVFAAVRPLCESALDGYNITVLAYGQVPLVCCVEVLWWY